MPEFCLISKEINAIELMCLKCQCEWDCRDLERLPSPKRTQLALTS
jgi:hypothetical protein